jgi:hypothetical protein
VWKGRGFLGEKTMEDAYGQGNCGRQAEEATASKSWLCTNLCWEHSQTALCNSQQPKEAQQRPQKP